MDLCCQKPVIRTFCLDRLGLLVQERHMLLTSSSRLFNTASLRSLICFSLWFSGVSGPRSFSMSAVNAKSTRPFKLPEQHNMNYDTSVSRFLQCSTKAREEYCVYSPAAPLLLLKNCFNFSKVLLSLSLELIVIVKRTL